MRAEEIEATIKRLIKSEEGIVAAIQLVEQMVQAGGIDERAEERLRGVIERWRIRFAVENSLDGGAFDSSGMSYENVIASMEDLVEEFEEPKEKEWAQTVTAMLGSDKAAGEIKQGGGVARRRVGVQRTGWAVHGHASAHGRRVGRFTACAYGCAGEEGGRAGGEGGRAESDRVQAGVGP